jgi:hypothetical protein
VICGERGRPALNEREARTAAWTAFQSRRYASPSTLRVNRGEATAFALRAGRPRSQE